jgi:hypothetical protein
MSLSARALRLTLLAAAAALLPSLGSCDGGSGAAECADGLDNDGDGAVDDADAACAAGATQEADDPPPACDDGVDNDGDGATDLEDPDCASASDGTEADDGSPDCDDGADNDGDGLEDYPDDPGCFSPLQDDEEDACPDGAMCPECGNGLDDDGDGDVDFPEDTGCDAASDDQERRPDPTACAGVPFEPMPDSLTVTATLQSGASRIASPTCGGTGSERVYELYVAEPSVLFASTNFSQTVFDSVLSLRTRCTDDTTELACNDNAAGAATGSTLTEAVEPGYYYVVVDGKGAASVGTFRLDVAFYPGPGTACDPAVPGDCAPGLVCRTLEGATGPTCEPPVCDDGVDDDADGTADFPADPGCASATDATEDDPCPGAGCPACANDVDDDGDGQADFPADTGCTSASQPLEGCGAERDAFQRITSGTVSGTTVGAQPDFALTCATTGSAPDVVYVLDLPQPVTTLSVNAAGFDTVVAIKDAGCSATNLACSDGQPTTASNLPAGTYAVIVDGYGTSSGAFTLTTRGTVPAGAACTDPAFAAGILQCPAANPCDGSVCALPACSDSVDNDADGRTDYPFDPGCTTASDTAETDPCPGAGCPACGNGLDDDADGDTDYPADGNCSSASGSSEACADTDPVGVITGSTTTGTTVGLTSNFTLSCGSGTATAPDKVLLLDLPVAVSSLTIDTDNSSYDTVLALKPGDCAGAELDCDDDGGSTGSASLVQVSNLLPGSYAVIVDGYSGASGAYAVNVSGTAVVGAACTDPLFTAGVLQCPSTHPCDGATCAPPDCDNGVDDDGDGLTDYPEEPGCVDALDPSENDPCPGAGCPACANGVDDDGDGTTDYPADAACSSAAATSETCADRDPIDVITQPQTFGTTVGLFDDGTLACGFGASPDRIFLLNLPVPVDSLSVNTTGSAFDTVLALKDASCGSANLACNDGATTSAFTVTGLAAGSYAIVLDGYSDDAGVYQLNVVGTVAAGTACDSPLFGTGVLRCPTGSSCHPVMQVCQ